MGQLVKIEVGDWEREGPGLWKFHVDHTRVKYDVIMKESDSYSSVIGIVREKYKLDQILLPTKPVLLTYDFSEYTTTSGEYTSPLVEIVGTEIRTVDFRLNKETRKTLISQRTRISANYHTSSNQNTRITTIKIRNRKESKVDLIPNLRMSVYNKV
ncbi:hypothetical protein F2Q68_00020686 [Brassica cretica]|uniref:Uncharacterized protein n=1 Tax=Brassica cretica TaxID=69181 RepID=A0A8S9FVY5_BRACR|nr:hypothetical protein F2Q68_00020686 [Brassica cretica]